MFEKKQQQQQPPPTKFSYKSILSMMLNQKENKEAAVSLPSPNALRLVCGSCAAGLAVLA